MRFLSFKKHIGIRWKVQNPCESQKGEYDILLFLLSFGQLSEELKIIPTPTFVKSLRDLKICHKLKQEDHVICSYKTMSLNTCILEK